MKKYIEYGVLSAAILTLVYLVISYFVQGYLNLQTIFLCIGGGIVTGVVITILFIQFSPGLYIPEGEEDSYID